MPSKNAARRIRTAIGHRDQITDLLARPREVRGGRLGQAHVRAGRLHPTPDATAGGVLAELPADMLKDLDEIEQFRRLGNVAAAAAVNGDAAAANGH